jgi:hypothetical protein
MRKTIYVVDVVPKKTGQKKDKTFWTLYSVVDQDKVKYSTFEDRFIALKGMETEIDYVDEPYISRTDGKQYMSHKILELGHKPVNLGVTQDGMARANNPMNHHPLPSPEMMELSKRIASLEDRVGQLEVNAMDPNGEFAKQVDEEPELKPEDLPF